MKYLPSIFKRSGNKDHQAVFDALDNAINDVRTSTDQLPNELKITTATGEWLDRWSEWFGVYRRQNETDEDLRNRILDVLMKDKLTIPAIVDLTKKVLGPDTVVTVYEPHVDIFQLDGSTLDNYRLMDADFYRIGVVEVSIDKPATEEWIALLELIKGAGIKIIGRGI
jgi:hypothetical protein